MSEKKIWNYLMEKIGNPYGVAGLMGNLYAESGLKSNNLQNTYARKLGFTDAEYTKAVDDGSYTNFVKDSAGYGLAQWTFWSRKQALKNYADSKGASIGNLDMQLDYLMKELSGSYRAVLNTLKNASSVLEASNAVLLKYERPADQSASVQSKRAAYGQTYYDKYAEKKKVSIEVPVLKKGNKGNDVRALQAILNALGYNSGTVDGDFGSNTLAAVNEFQKAKGLSIDGSVGPATWTALLNE